MRTLKALRLAPPATARIEEVEPIVMEWDVKPVGAQRVRELLGCTAGEPIANASTWRMRSFEVREVAAGRGVWLDEIHANGGRSAPTWVEDPEAAEYLEPGAFVSALMPPGGPITLPRFWRGCQSCEQERARRRRGR